VTQGLESFGKVLEVTIRGSGISLCNYVYSELQFHMGLDFRNGVITTVCCGSPVHVGMKTATVPRVCRDGFAAHGILQ